MVLSFSFGEGRGGGGGGGVRKEFVVGDREVRFFVHSANDSLRARSLMSIVLARARALLIVISLYVYVCVCVASM